MNTIATSKLLSGSILDEQMRLEESAISDGVARYNRLANEAIDRGDGASLKPAERLMVYWYSPLVEAIQKEQDDARAGKPQVGVSVWGCPITSVPADKLAVITLHEMIGACMASLPDGAMRVEVVNNIGRAVFAEINLGLMKIKDGETRDRRDARLEAGEDKKTVYSQEREDLKDLTRRFRNMNPHRVNWWAKKKLGDPKCDRQATMHVGAMLVYLAHENCGLPTSDGSFKLAFHRTSKQVGRKTKSTISLDWDAIKIIDEGHEIRKYMRPRYLPMLTKPCTVSHESQGGYIHIQTPFVSKPTREQKAAMEAADLTIVYDAINAINSPALRENVRIKAIIDEVWSTGGGELGIPHRNNLPDEPEPAGYDESLFTITSNGKRRRSPWKNVSREVKRDFKKRSEAVIAENIRRVSTRQEFISKHNIATRFANEEAIYEPHQFCFRGRTYPIPIHLNHQGDDVCRGLLELSEAKTPDAEGLRALKINAANLYGIDDVGFDDRVKWTERNWENIMRSADDPLGFRWWTHADEKMPGQCDGKPWQFLAACMALSDPNGAGARLILYSDGTANGLQHYTALGRDAKAAPFVNMTPGDNPKSVYHAVAAEVDTIVKQDARSNPVSAALIDRVGHITKPLVKQPIMTLVYGVTDYGAAEQVGDALAKLGFENEDLFNAKLYLSKVVLNGVGSVCERSVEIMKWIRECASLIVKKDRTVAWTSPVGFPVVQRDRNLKKFKVHTILGTITLVADDATAPINKRAQVNGSAPNFIHSVDAAHMMMTAISCHKQDITTVFIHDAYGTHAQTYRAMNRELRVQYVALHERDLLGELVAEWREKHPDIEFPDPPARGTFDIRKVLDSDYFFH